MKQVVRLLGISDELTMKKNQNLFYKCCSDCFSQVSDSIEQLQKTNPNKARQFRTRSDSVHESDASPGVQTARFFNYAASGGLACAIKGNGTNIANSNVSPSRHSGPLAGSPNRRAYKQHQASSFGVIAFQSQTLLSDITLSMGADDRLSHAVKQHNFHQVSGLEEFMIEINKIKLTESLTVGIVENFLTKLQELDMDENLEYDPALEHLVKIYAVTSRNSMFDDELAELEEESPEKDKFDAFTEGAIRATRGTIIQKVMRSRVQIANTAINNILLMSLPITSPYRAFDKQRPLQALVRAEAGYTTAVEMRETALLPQAGTMIPRSTTNNTSSVHSLVDMDEGLNRESGLLGIQPNQRVIGSDIQGFQLIGGANLNSNTVKSQKPKVSFAQDMYISLDSFTFVKRQFTNYVLEHIDKYQVELIFSTETLPASLFEALKKKDVLAVFPISEAEMQLLSMVLNTSIIQDVSLLTKDIARDYLGNIRKYYMVNVQDSDNRYQNSLLFLDQTSTAAIEPTKSLGIAIYYEKADVSEALRNLLRSQLTYLYYALTEHELIYRERDQTRALNQTVQLNWEEIGDFRSPLSSVKHNIRNLLNANNPDLMAFERTEIILDPLDEETVYPDFDDYSNQIERFFQKICSLEGIKMVHDIKNKVDESLESPKEYENFNYLFNTDSDIFCNLNITKGDGLYVASSTETKVVMPYSDKDTTIARFLKRYFKMLKADAEGEDVLQHREVGYYIADACIRLKVSNFQNKTTKSKFKKIATEAKRESLYLRGLFFNRLIAKMTLFRSTRSSVASKHSNNAADLLRQNSSVFTANGGKLPSHPGGEKANKSDLTTSKDNINALVNQNATIRSYIVCDTCHCILSDYVLMEGFWKNMSFAMFLYNFATARPSQSLFNVGKNLRQMQNTQLFGENALHEDFCPHSKQSRAFHLGSSVIQFTRYPLQVHRLIHFSNRDVLLGLDPLLLEMKRGYLTHQRQYQDKVAVELSEYFIKQITLLIYALKDFLARACKQQPISHIIQPKRKGSAVVHAGTLKQVNLAELQTRLTLMVLQLSEMVRKIYLINHYCGKRQQVYKTNPMLRSVHNNLKHYSSLLTELCEIISPEKTELIQRAPAALKFSEVVSKICKMNLELLQDQASADKNHAEEKSARDTRYVSKMMSNFGGNQEKPQTTSHSNSNLPGVQASGFAVRPTLLSNLHHFPSGTYRYEGTLRKVNSVILPSDDVSISDLLDAPEPPKPTRSKEEIELSRYDAIEPKSPVPMMQRAVSVRQDLPNRRITTGNCFLKS